MFSSLSWGLVALAVTLVENPLPPAAAVPTVTMVGVTGPHLPPDIAAAWSERLLRALIAEGFSVLGPGDVSRKLGQDLHTALLACLVAESCPQDLLGRVGSQALMFVSVDEKMNTRISALTAEGVAVGQWELGSGPLRIADSLERIGPRVSSPLKSALGLTRLNQPPPWKLLGHTAVGVAVGFAVLGTASFADSARRYDQLRNASPASLSATEAVSTASIGKMELFLGGASVALAAGSVFLATYFYRRGETLVPPSSLALSWSLGPGGLVVGGIW